MSKGYAPFDPYQVAALGTASGHRSQNRGIKYKKPTRDRIAIQERARKRYYVAAATKPPFCASRSLAQLAGCRSFR